MNHLTSEQRTIAAQRERIDELEEELRQIKERKTNLIFPIEWGLTPAHRRVLQALYEAPGGFLSHDQVWSAARLWADGEDQGGVVRAQIFKMRTRLKPTGIEIKSRWGDGYELSAGSKAIIRTAIEQRVAA